MKELFWQYLKDLYQAVPIEVYEGLLSVFSIGAVILLTYNGIKNGWRKVTELLLVEYITLLYCSMVIFRTYSEGVGHNFHPLWSYAAIHEGIVDLIPENVMNVVVFLPVGLLLGITFTKIKWWQALLLGTGISMLIELLQLIFGRGFSEMDDVIHNTLGCMLGFGMSQLTLKLHNNTI